MHKYILSLVLMAMSSPLWATGHFPHTSGQFADWRWKDVQGYYTASTLGARKPAEAITVFCADPEAFGGVSFAIGVDGTQVGERRLTLSFNNGAQIDVIANYGRVTAKSAAGHRIIMDVLGQMRNNQVMGAWQDGGAPMATFSLSGSREALGPCP